MKVAIEITGQPNGNNTLLKVIRASESEVKKLSFGNFQIVFPNYDSASEALVDAFNVLKDEDPDFNSIELMPNNNMLVYDASVAKII